MKTKFLAKPPSRKEEVSLGFRVLGGFAPLRETFLPFRAGFPKR
jgi:hypothetical protein